MEEKLVTAVDYSDSKTGHWTGDSPDVSLNAKCHHQDLHLSLAGFSHNEFNEDEMEPLLPMHHEWLYNASSFPNHAVEQYVHQHRSLP